MMARQFTPQERLRDFLLKGDVSAATIDTLRNFLIKYEPTQRKKIINAPLARLYNRTSVHIAADKGLTPFLRILLTHGGNPNVESALPDLKQTPLHLAAKGGYWQCMDVLLEYGAKLNVEDMQRRTPRDHIRGRPKCTLVVTHHIAKYSIPQRSRTEEETVKSLHEMVSEEEDIFEQFQEAYSPLFQHHQDLAARWLDLGNITLLYRACSYNCERIVKFLLDCSDQTPLPNLGRGDTPLHIACKQSNTRLVELLLDHSPKLALISDTMMDKRHSPLHTVCLENGNKQIVEIILGKISFLLDTEEYSEDSPLDLNVRDADGCTALYRACYFGYEEVVSMLLKFQPKSNNYRPFNLSVSSLKRRTPLHVAVKFNHISTLEVLLNHIKNDKKNSTDNLVNLQGYPSTDTKKRVLQFVPHKKISAKPSIASMSSQTSAASCSDAFSIISEDEDMEQIPRVSSISSGRSLIGKSSVSELFTRTITSNPSVKKRIRSSTDFTENVDVPESLYITKDGTFLSQHKPPNAIDFDEVLLTPLAEACAWGHSQAVDMLLAAGALDVDGMAIRLAQLTKNHVLAYNIIRHHCKLLVESIVQPSSYALTVEWNGMKLSEVSGKWFTKDSSFCPASAEDDDNNIVLMASLPTEVEAFKLTSVILKKNNLTSLPVELFQLPNLVTLDASYNHIASLTPLISSPLQDINLSNNKLIELPISLWNLPHLKCIELQKNILQSLGEEDNADITKLSESLTTVDISWNQLEILPSFVLDLPSLEELNASHNELTKLPANLWECLSLKELNLSNNVLFELPSCEPQSSLMSSLPSDKQTSFAAVQYGRRVVGAKAHLEANFDKFRNRSTVLRRRRTSVRFVKALETPQEAYSEEYITHNENCCGVEKINLSRNKLTMFPDALPCLAPLLAELDISHNEITEIDVSCLPPMMRKLLASHNKINKLGTIIDRKLKDYMIRHCRMIHSEQKQDCRHRTHKEMKNLSTIDLSCNMLEIFQLMKSSGYVSVRDAGSLRRHMGLSQLDLLYPQLENLRLYNNNLKGCFSHDIGFLSQLKSITLGSNPELEALPMEFAYFKKCPGFTQLSWNDLPKLRDPPPECKGMALRPLLSYMSSRLKKSVFYRYIKLIVVGCGERGKTTLLRRLRGLPFEGTGRTIGIDIEKWTYPTSPSHKQQPITFMTWDFAGQDIYSTTHQCFYSRRSLYLALYRLNDEGGVDELDSWLRNIKLRAPDSPVIVIGTHLDQVTKQIAAESEARVKERYNDSRLYPTLVEVCSISCTQKGSIFRNSSIDHLRGTIYRVATHLKVAHDGFKLAYDKDMAEDHPEALFQQKIPQVYLDLQEAVRKVMVEMRIQQQPPVMRSEEFRKKFLEVTEDEEELSDAVQYLHHQGTLLHFTDQALKNVYFLDPQWLCDMMSSVIRVPRAGEESLVNNGFVEINELVSRSRLLEDLKDECINLLSKFDIALRLENHLLLVPSLLSPDPPTSLPTVNISNRQVSDVDKFIAYPPLWKFWFTEFIPNGFWPRLVCRLTTNHSINKTLKSLFAVLLMESPGYQSSKDDAFLPWRLWKSGLALAYKETLLLEVKEAVNKTDPSEDVTTAENCSFRIEACVNVPGWITVARNSGTPNNDQDTPPDVAGDATSIMVEIIKHITSLATDWFPGMFVGDTIEGQVPCFVPCWKCCCCCKSSSTNDGQQPGLEQVIPSFSLMRGDSTVYCWGYDTIIIPAIKRKSLWCDAHASFNIEQLAPELYFRDLGDYTSYHQEPLWIDTEHELGKGGFGVVLKGELGHEDCDKEPVAIKVLLPEADRKLQNSSLKEVLQSASSDHLIPQSYHDVRQEVSILSKLNHDNLTRLCGVRTTPIIQGTTSMICLMLELASKRSLRDVLKRYRNAKRLLEPITLKTTICQISSGLEYLHRHQIAHLDIKSPNVLVWEFPLQLSSRQDILEHATEVLVKIADYGTSRISTVHGIMANNPTGTPGYMAPELFSHQGQEIAPDKVDVFAFGMTIYELLTMRPPYDELPRKDPAILHKAVRDGRRPRLTDKEARSPVLVQDMMQLCWEHEPNNRPNMSQVVQWAETIEFDSLRVDSNLVEVTAISTTCVGRIDPSFEDNHFSHSDTAFELLASQAIGQGSLSVSLMSSASVASEGIETSLIQPRTGRDGMGEMYRRVGAMDEAHTLSRDSGINSTTSSDISGCTQTWLCGRDKRKGLVTIFTYQDNVPGYSLFYGYACEQEISAICAIYNYVWLGNVEGELRVIHALTMRTIFVRHLASKDHTPECILDIVHVKDDHKVMVSTHNCDVWIFLDIPDQGGLRLHSHIQFSDQYSIFHMTVAVVNGSPEVWGTCSENKLMVFQHHQSKWEYSELQCEPFSGGRLLICALVTSSVFTGSHGDTRCHVWVSFNRRSYFVCWDAVKKKQLHVVDCKQDMKLDDKYSQGLQVSAMQASGCYLYVGTTVGVIGVWSSEHGTMLQCLHYHEHKVRALLLMPPQVSPCVCPEIPISDDDDDDGTNISSDIPLITSIGNGRKKFLLNPNSDKSMKYLQRHDEDICLLTWQCLK